MFSEVSYAGWKRNLKIADGTAELVVTLDVGPRILFGAPAGGKNLFAEIPAQLGGSGEDKWMIRGGHRFWTAPENDESYALDNVPVDYRQVDAKTIEIASPASPFGWQKTLRLAAEGQGRFTVTHTLLNSGTKPIDATPWALSVMAPGGVATIPQPAFVPHPLDLPPGAPFTNDDLQCNRKVVLWKYTRLDDPRFTLGREFWHIAHRTGCGATKFGLLYSGKVAYQLGNAVFAKTVPLVPGGLYPDDGVNFELFSNDDILELETLAPLAPLAPGQSRVHTETWQIGKWDQPLTAPGEAKKFFESLG